MLPISRHSGAFSLLAFALRTVTAQDYPICQAFGVDFQSGGSYFQNSLSDEQFTFVSQFSDCQDDFAYNILVDPDGDQVLCTDTQLTPDDTNMLSTCPLEKNQLRSGEWSVVIISNNGEAEPIAYERDFSLSVGPQSTSTFTPTLTETIISSPRATITITETDTIIETLEPKTVTSPSTTVTPTKTVTPMRVTSTTTKALFTLSLRAYTVDIQQATATETASCRVPRRQAFCDPVATIRPTVGPLAHTFGNRFRREVEHEKKRFVEARASRLSARAPDPQPLIVTDTNTDDWPTVTTTSIAPTSTATMTTEVETTSTETPPPVTVLEGRRTADVVTITAPTPTKTRTRYNIATTVSTKTLHLAYTVTTKVTPSAVASACKSNGGTLW